MTFFIFRPVFAWVIAIIIMLSGIFAINTLPISQYPNVAPPTIGISASYPGADAQTIENSVTQVIEQSLTGIDGMLYFTSSSSSAGSVRISVTFEQDTDVDTAQVQVQNKVQKALTRLPIQVQEQGISVNKSQSDFLLIAALYDKSNKLTASDISDFLVSNIQDPLSRIEGVGDVRVFGSSYAMRIWIDPIKLSSKNLTTNEIIASIKEQNTEVSAGKIGAQPASQYQQITATVKAQSKLKSVKEFENIIIKNLDGAKVLLKDVAKIEIGQENYGASPKLNGFPASGVAVMLAPNSNALDTSIRVKELFSKYENSFPEGVEVAFPKDSTDFIKISINEVVKTLFEAIALVVIIMFIFLQNVRATIVPTLTIPVVILGTFGILALFGYSINTLTLFALVLSIGLLVDDSIVVVENIERLMKEEKLNAKDATIKSMKEISSALVGIAVVLSAVFLPMAFFGGSSGVIYRQFSITIISSMMLSVIVALVLTPAICATFLKPIDHKEKGFFGWFNRVYDGLQNKYKSKVKFIFNRKISFIIIYSILCIGLVFMFNKLPGGFVPKEDQGEVMVQYTLPAGATMNRTDEVGDVVRKYFLETEKNNTNYIFTISGFNFSGSAQNAGMAFVALKDWSEREGLENTSEAIAGRAMGALSQLKDASVFALTMPSISGLGNSAGFTFYLQGVGDRESLIKSRDLLLKNASENPKLQGIRMNELKEMPSLKINIDTEKATALGVSISDINSTISNAWGGTYVNDFIDRGKVKKVYVQSDEKYRSLPDDLNHWYVKNNSGTMTSIGSFAKYEWIVGPETLGRYNGLPSYEIQGQGAEGISSGEAMLEIEKLLADLPSGVVYSWSGLSYQEKMSQGKSAFLYSISILVVFLCLAALYESWTIPLSVLFVIPLGVIGAVLSAYFRGLENDVYFQVALLTTIGLAAKNAILIVEFAEINYKKGMTIIDSAINASVARLRPIIMTSFAFIAGVIPLAIATGAGANSRMSIGTAVVGGTITATFLAIFFVPLFFIIVKSIFSKDNKGEEHAE